jgi:hypothetical protein
MGNHARQMKRARVVRASVACQPIHPFGIEQAPGTMMGNRGSQYFPVVVPGTHRRLRKDSIQSQDR